MQPRGHALGRLRKSTSSDVAFMNKQRFPTFVTFVPTGRGGMIPGLAIFLKKYKWMTVSVHCESLLNYFSVASLFGSQCRAVKSLMMNPTSGFTVHYEDFDSVRNPSGFEGLLARAKLRSRNRLFGAGSGPEGFHQGSRGYDTALSLLSHEQDIADLNYYLNYQFKTFEIISKAVTLD
ncbi:hypothetical protein RvY_11664 [Ramazzottius varieornatus]|uniref:Receptor ligand binding region domain-containing protein n=1 Tax=Ramazzottius varieornatus TaxID=947166 RepID=A0A1D1VJA2_RAMVA|nr:hypothetical protein RvY_11664 [Ramazzottius varieornatus]